MTLLYDTHIPERQKFSGDSNRDLHQAGDHFVAQSTDGLHRHSTSEGGVVIFDPFDYGSDYGLPADDTVYQGQERLRSLRAIQSGVPQPVREEVSPRPTTTASG
jgi:hypothetical protein